MKTITVDHGNIHQIKKIEIKKNTFSEGTRQYITIKLYEDTNKEIQVEHEFSLFSDKGIEPDINFLMDSYEIKAVADYGVQGREDEVLALIKIPFQIHQTDLEEEQYIRNITKLYNDVKSLYVDHTEGVVTASLTFLHEDVNI